MISFFKALFRRRTGEDAGHEPELRGAPARERWKNYAAENGFVYLYVYRGYRVSPEGAQEFVFEVRDGPGTRSTSVWLGSDVARQVEERLGRKLLDQERYAVAKMALYQAFDVDAEDAPKPNAEETFNFLTKLGRVS